MSLKYYVKIIYLKCFDKVGFSSSKDLCEMKILGIALSRHFVYHATSIFRLASGIAEVLLNGLLENPMTCHF